LANLGIKLFRNDEAAGAAVVEHEAVIVSVSSVLTGTGTTPALMAPRNAVGQSMVSSKQMMMRSSRRTPSERSAWPKRSTRSASAP
jgi:hypothetical protein